MGTTALQIIERAFSKAGVKPAETPLTNAEVQDALDTLNDMLSEWDVNGTLKGAVPVETVNDDLIIPRFAFGAVKANLAIRLAPEYDRVVTQGMAFDATDSLKELVKATINLSDLDYPSTLPVGSGNQDGLLIGIEEEFFRGDKRRNF